VAITYGPADFGFTPSQVTVVNLDGSPASLASGPTVDGQGHITFSADAGTYQVRLRQANSTDLITHQVTLQEPSVNGGSSPVKRAWFRAVPESITSGGALHPLTWTHLNGETDILDLTDPTAPTQVTAGTLSVTVNICCDSGTQPGKSAFIELDLDENADDATASATFSLDVDIPGMTPQSSMSLTYFAPAAGLIQAFVKHAAATALDFWLEAAVQWRADTAVH
jgi:hypothetical protein